MRQGLLSNGTAKVQLLKDHPNSQKQIGGIMGKVCVRGEPRSLCCWLTFLLVGHITIFALVALTAHSRDR